MSACADNVLFAESKQAIQIYIWHTWCDMNVSGTFEMWVCVWNIWNVNIPDNDRTGLWLLFSGVVLPVADVGTGTIEIRIAFKIENKNRKKEIGFGWQSNAFISYHFQNLTFI